MQLSNLGLEQLKAYPAMTKSQAKAKFGGEEKPEDAKLKMQSSARFGEGDAKKEGESGFKLRLNA